MAGAAWQDAFAGVRTLSTFHKRKQQRDALRALDMSSSGVLSRRARAFRQRSRARLCAHAVLLLMNMVLFVVDGHLRPKPDPDLLEVAAKTWGRGGARAWLDSNATHLAQYNINLTADGFVDFGSFDPLTSSYALILALRGAAFLAIGVLWYAEVHRNLASDVLVAVLLSPSAQTLMLNLLANLVLGGFVAAMEWQFAHYVTWARFVLSNGMHFLGFFMLMVTDALFEKTKGLRRLWFAMALLLSIYNLITRLTDVFENEQISLTQVVRVVSATLGGANVVSVLDRGVPDITVQTARRTIDYTLCFLVWGNLTSVAFKPDLLCFVKVNFTLEAYRKNMHTQMERRKQMQESRTRERHASNERTCRPRMLGAGGAAKTAPPGTLTAAHAYACPAAGDAAAVKHQLDMTCETLEAASATTATRRRQPRPLGVLAAVSGRLAQQVEHYAEAFTTGGVEASQAADGELSSGEVGGDEIEGEGGYALVRLRPPPFMGPPSGAPLGTCVAPSHTLPLPEPPPLQAPGRASERASGRSRVSFSAVRLVPQKELT